MTSILMLCVFIERLTCASAFVVGKSKPHGIAIPRKIGISTSVFISSHEVRSNISDVDEYEENCEDAATVGLFSQLEEKDWELQDLRAEIDQLSSQLQQKEHQGRQFNEYYPMFCEQMKEKSSEIEALKLKVEGYEEKFQRSNNSAVTSDGTKEVDQIDGAKDFELEDLKQKYEMELAFLSYDLAAKDSQIEILNKKIDEFANQFQESQSIRATEMPGDNLAPVELQNNDEMQTAFHAQDLIAKDYKIEQLTQTIVELTNDMKEAEQNSKHEYNQLEKRMTSEMEKSSKKIQDLQHSVNLFQSEQRVQEKNKIVTEDANKRLLESGDIKSKKSPRKAKSHFLESTLMQTGGQVMSTPHDVVKYE